MILDFYQHLPQYIGPIAFSFGPIHVRWYSLSYLVGFVVTYFILLSKAKKNDFNEIAQIFNFQFSIFNKFINSKFKISSARFPIRNTKYQIQNTILDFLLVSFFAALIGGRLGFVLFYDFPFFLKNPFLIFSPFQNGKMIGYYGMSYHGALLAVMVSTFIFVKIKKIRFFAWADFVAPAAALGYFFGRIGNFLNGELYGRVTSSKFGMYFLTDPENLRHPSQIYEAISEGIVLFIVLWVLSKKKMAEGSIFCFYLIGYGVIRILMEFFREPDEQLGYIFGIFTMGQLLSLMMIILGLVIFFRTKQIVAVGRK